MVEIKNTQSIKIPVLRKFEQHKFSNILDFKHSRGAIVGLAACFLSNKNSVCTKFQNSFFL